MYKDSSSDKLLIVCHLGLEPEVDFLDQRQFNMFRFESLHASGRDDVRSKTGTNERSAAVELVRGRGHTSEVQLPESLPKRPRFRYRQFWDDREECLQVQRVLLGTGQRRRGDT